MLFAKQMNLLFNLPFLFFFFGLFLAAAIVRVLQAKATTGDKHVQIYRKNTFFKPIR